MTCFEDGWPSSVLKQNKSVIAGRGKLAAMVGNTLSGAVADAVGIHRMFSLMSLLAFLGSAFAWKAAHIPKERRVSE